MPESLQFLCRFCSNMTEICWHDKSGRGFRSITNESGNLLRVRVRVLPVSSIWFLYVSFFAFSRCTFFPSHFRTHSPIVPSHWQRNPKISGPLLFFCSISFFAVFIFLMSQCSIFKLCLSDRIVLQLYLPPEMFYNLITPASLSLEKERKETISNQLPRCTFHLTSSLLQSLWTDLRGQCKGFFFCVVP